MFVFAVVGLAIQPIADRCHAESDARQGGEVPKKDVQPYPVAPPDLSPLYERLERIDKSIEALKPSPETADEYRRAEGDLKAQKDMADWARVMAYVTGASVVVSALGVGLIVLTLRQNKRSLRIALAGVRRSSAAIRETKRIGEAQARAYLSVIRADLELDRRPRIHPQIDAIELYLTFHNSGATPAINVSHYCRSEVVRYGDVSAFSSLEFVPEQEFITNIPPNVDQRREITCFGLSRDLSDARNGYKSVTDQTPFEDYPVLLIEGVVFYDDVFGATYRSQFGFWFACEPHPTNVNGEDDLPTIQAPIPTFERIASRDDYVKCGDTE